MQDVENDRDDGTWRARATSALLGLMGLSSARSEGDTTRPLVHARRRPDDASAARKKGRKRTERALRDCGLD